MIISNRSIKYIIVFSILALIGCGGNAENLLVGNKAPDSNLTDAFGKNYSLKDYHSKSPVILYFYPKAGTPGCTKQACGVRDSFQSFKDNGITIFGVSVDSKESIKEFIDEYNLNFPLLSDESKSVSRAYGVLNNLGLTSRITFIIDKQGYISHILRDVDVNTHADEVLKLAIELK